MGPILIVVEKTIHVLTSLTRHDTPYIFRMAVHVIVRCVFNRCLLLIK